MRIPIALVFCAITYRIVMRLKIRLMVFFRRLRLFVPISNASHAARLRARP
jgi:hypothetical protein